MESIAEGPDEAVWPEYIKRPERCFRLVLVDDHPVVRAGLAALLSLEPDLKIVGEAGDIDAAIGLVRECAPDLVICDLTLPGYTGCLAVRRLCREFPHMQVMVLSAHCSLECIRESFDSGAIGYVRKDAPRADLLSALRRAVRGLPATCSGVGNIVIRDWMQGVEVAPRIEDMPLDAEDRQVLRLIALGVPTWRIAAELGRGVKAVEKYRTSLMRRLNLNSTAAIARFAVKCKLLSLQEVDQLVSVD